MCLEWANSSQLHHPVNQFATHSSPAKHITWELIWDTFWIRNRWVLKKSSSSKIYNFFSPPTLKKKQKKNMHLWTQKEHLWTQKETFPPIPRKFPQNTPPKGDTIYKDNFFTTSKEEISQNTIPKKKTNHKDNFTRKPPNWSAPTSAFKNKSVICFQNVWEGRNRTGWKSRRA